MLNGIQQQSGFLNAPRLVAPEKEPLMVRVNRLEQEKSVQGAMIDELRRRVSFLESAIGDRLAETSNVMPEGAVPPGWSMGV